MKRLAYSVCAAILLGQAVAMVSRSDRNWPFSTVPMFSKIRVQPEHVLVALFGVTEQGEFPLTRSGVISFRLHRLLAKGLSDSPDPDEEEAEQRRALADYVALQYDRWLEAGQDSPLLLAVRAYRVNWDLEALGPGANSPTSRQLQFEEVLVR